MASAWRLNATEALAALERRDLSARELVESCLAQIAANDPALKSFVTVCADLARDEADLSDARGRSGAARRPLEGLPFAVKDLTDTAGVRTTYGSLLFKDHVPVADELCVARLRAAGAILIGKTNTPEFGFGPRSVNRLCGATANPHDARLSAGGSSGGSAAAVATGLVPLAHGTDFGGSVRTPAAFCGVVGLRPTPGLIPSVSRSMAWNALATHGVLARSVDDAALMLSAMAGYDRRDPISRPGLSAAQTDRAPDIETLRIGASPDLGVAPMSLAVRSRFDQALAQVATCFPAIETGAPDCAGGREAFAVLRGALVRRQFGALVASHRGELTPQLIWNVEKGDSLAADDLLAAEEARSRIYAAFMRFFERHDLLMTPSAAVMPFPNTQEEVTEIDGRPLAGRIDYLAITYLISLVGLPCISIPCGWTGDGCPIGLQIVAPPWREDLLLRTARRLEQDLGFRHRWPAPIASPAIVGGSEGLPSA
ncbi:MAG: amidase [Roseiarcus sp.]